MTKMSKGNKRILVIKATRTKMKENVKTFMDLFYLFILDPIGPYPKLANRCDFRGSGGALTFHCYILIFQYLTSRVY